MGENQRDWRNENWKIHNFNLSLLETGKFSDIEFIVGRNAVKAHKFILSVRSSVFETMFDSKWCNNDTIEIPDTEHETFMTFLKFLYTDAFSSTTTVEEAGQLLYLGFKYNTTSLITRCNHLLQRKMSPANVIGIHKLGALFDISDLKSVSWRYLLGKANQVFREEEFLSIDVKFLREITESEDLCVPEKEVFAAVLSWSEQEIKRQNLPQTMDKIRHVLDEGKILQNLRFTQMSAMEFAIAVAGSGILSKDEENLILRHFVVDNELKYHLPPLPFNTKKRNISPEIITGVHTACVYLSTAITAITTSSPMPPAEINAESLEFSVDRDINILGIGFYGPGYDQYENGEVRNVQSTYDIECALYSMKTPGRFPSVTSHVKRSITTARDYDIILTTPKKIQSGRVYRIRVAIKGRETQHGTSRLSSTIIPINGGEVGFTFISRFNPNTLLGSDEAPGHIRSIIFSPDDDGLERE